MQESKKIRKKKLSIFDNIIKDKVKIKLQILLRKRGKYIFIRNLRKGSRVLDVGCGNNSPYYTKLAKPCIEYWGIDICNHNQTKPNDADFYIISRDEMFAKDIANLKQKFDAIISSHNLEHCSKPNETLEAILQKVVVGGKLYISFPNEDSKEFPSRSGTLNYHDDPTHRQEMPKYSTVLNQLKKDGMIILYATRNYRPMVLRLIGHLVEPLSRVTKRVLPGTWERYGFESIIIAEKVAKASK